MEDFEPSGRSPGLPSSGSHLFPAAKEHLGGHIFQSAEYVKVVVTLWLCAKDTTCYEMDMEENLSHT